MRRISALGAAIVLSGLAASTSAQGPAGANFREMFLQLDANGDTVLERDEIPEAGRAAFDRLLKKGDLDKNGKLEADEMRDMGKKLASVGGNAGEMVAERIKAMDKDGDGKVSKAEFKGIPANFEKIDADKDGAITRQEFQAYAASMRPGGATPPVAEKAKARLKAAAKKARAKGGDAAKPSAKTDSEAAKPGKKPVEAAAAPMKRFKAMDKDGDGKLSKSEFPREKIFERLDADNDGFLTPGELAKGRKPGA